MTPFRGNRFDVFFAHDTYVALKNLLYSYLLRKLAIGKYIRDCREDLILEVGSGLSPMVTDSNHVVYSEVSFPVTFPHRRNYFANDDGFVGHFRRYELKEMEERLREAGLNPVETRKVLGPLEKVTMFFVISLISLQQSFGGAGKYPTGNVVRWKIMAFLFKWFNRLYCVPV
ncbi:MAG: hypothetical protein Q7J31_03150 [Syntrophales bacterium]|nr:hypothetical protein [Syntrophales bacterium]